jgi:hypothetical protein
MTTELLSNRDGLLPAYGYIKGGTREQLERVAGERLPSCPLVLRRSNGERPEESGSLGLHPKEHGLALVLAGGTPSDSDGFRNFGLRVQR